MHDNWHMTCSLDELNPTLYAYSVNKDVSINSIVDGPLDGVQWSWNVKFSKGFHA